MIRYALIWMLAIIIARSDLKIRRVPLLVGMGFLALYGPHPSCVPYVGMGVLSIGSVLRWIAAFDALLLGLLMSENSLWSWFIILSSQISLLFYALCQWRSLPMTAFLVMHIAVLLPWKEI